MFYYSTNCHRNRFEERKTVIIHRFTRFRTNLRNLRISQDICYVRMTDIVNILTKYGPCAHVLNNKSIYNIHKFVIYSPFYEKGYEDFQRLKSNSIISTKKHFIESTVLFLHFVKF